MDSVDLSENIQPSVSRRRLSVSLSTKSQAQNEIKIDPRTRKLQSARRLSAFLARPSVDEKFQRKNIKPNYITVYLYFKCPIEIDTMRKLLFDRLVVEFSRFRSKVYMDSKNDVYFEEKFLDEVNMQYHVECIESKGWSQQDIDTFLHTKSISILDSNEPLWKMYVLNHLQDGRSCLAAKIDHTIADGVSLVEILFSLMDDDFDTDEGKKSLNSSALVNPASRPSNASNSSLTTFEYFCAIGHGFYEFLLATMKVLPCDSPNTLKLADTSTIATQLKVCAVGYEIPLSKVKELKQKLKGCTVNDILTTNLNLCIYRYLEAQNDPVLLRPNDARINAVFPINARPKNQPIAQLIGNAWLAFGVFPLYFSFKSKIDLLWKVKRGIDWIKVSPRSFLEISVISNLMPYLPIHEMFYIWHNVSRLYTLMISNVQGPTKIIYLNGHEVVDINFFVDCHMGLYCGILSYNDSIRFSVTSAASIEPNPSNLTKYWKTEFDAMYDEIMNIKDPEELDIKNYIKKNQYPNARIFNFGISLLFISLILYCIGYIFYN